MANTKARNPETSHQLSVCPECGGLEERGGCRERTTQWCACRRGTVSAETWPHHDYNEHSRLCDCCGQRLLESGSKFSVWFCPECKARVVALNEYFGRAIIPIGRHSFMNGFALKGPPGADPHALEDFVERTFGMVGSINHLEAWKRDRIRWLVEEAEFPLDSYVDVHAFLERVDPSDEEPWSVSTPRRAFEGLCRHFGIHAWPTGHFTPIPKDEETDEGEHTLACPVCGARDGDCQHYVVMSDDTFPWACACTAAPLETSGVLDADLLGNAYLKARDVVAAQWPAGGRLPGVPKRLGDLVDALHGGSQELMGGCGGDPDSEEEDDEVEVDGYVDLRAVDSYLAEIFGGTPGYLGTTRHEDCIPMASSQYTTHWALDADTCAEAAHDILREDAQALARWLEDRPAAGAKA